MKEAYLDSSVVIREILDEKNKYHFLGRFRQVFTSELTHVEAFRTIDRLRILHDWSDSEVIYRIQLLHTLFNSIEFIPLQAAILRRASDPFPIAVKTLDAIHIASALLTKNRLRADLYFITHDLKQGQAALAAGLSAEGFGQNEISI